MFSCILKIQLLLLFFVLKIEEILQIKLQDDEIIPNMANHISLKYKTENELKFEKWAMREFGMTNEEQTEHTLPGLLSSVLEISNVIDVILLPVSLFSAGAKFVGKEALKEGGEELAEAAGKNLAQMAGKEAFQEAVEKGTKELAQVTTERAMKEAAVMATEKSVKELAEEVRENLARVTKEVVKETVEKAKKDIAKETIEKVTRTVFKMTDDTYALYRKNVNTGPFKDLGELMQLKNVKNIAKRAEIGIDGIKIKIDRNAELIGKSIYGFTDGKTITLYPDAFTNTEMLVKTLGHERIHVYQVSVFGKPASSNMLKRFEKAAFNSEKTWWDYYNLMMKGRSK